MTRADFLMLSLLVVISLALSVLAFMYGGVDFSVYYAAGRVVIQGGNPYDYQQLAGQIVSSAGKINNPYYYAPWFTWSILPLAFLPYDLARTVWAIVNFILWFLGLFNLNKVLDWPQSGWRRWGFYLLLTFVFAWATWGSEQVGILIFFMFTLLLLFIKNDKWNLAGVVLAFLLFKPNITIVPVLAISIWLIVRGRWQPVAVMAGMLAIMIVGSLLSLPEWYRSLLQSDKVVGLSYAFDASGVAQVTRYRTTLMDWLSVYDFEGTQAEIIYAGAILLGLVSLILVIIKSGTAIELLAFVFLINYALIPYALFYDYPPLVLTIFYFNQLFSRRMLSWAGILMNGAITFCLFIGDKIPYRYWMIVVLVLSYIFIRLVDVKRKSNRKFLI